MADPGMPLNYYYVFIPYIHHYEGFSKIHNNNVQLFLGVDLDGLTPLVVTKLQIYMKMLMLIKKS